MDPSPSSKMRGTILRVPDSNPGLLFLNGDQKPFTLEGGFKLVPNGEIRERYCYTSPVDK